MIGITTAGIAGSIDSFSDMKDSGIQQIDCSITSMLNKSSLFDIQVSDVSRLSEKLILNDIRCNSLQSIFYGFTGNLEDKDSLNHHMEKCFNILKCLNCDTILFGSPQQRRDKSFANKLIRNMSSLADYQNKKIAIENLDAFEGVWGQTYVDIQKEISANSLMNCSINLHIFVEDLIDLDALDIKKISSIHLSNRSYNTELLKDAKIETLEKAKALYQAVPSICVEFVKCSIVDSIRSFRSFREKWESL